MPIKGTPPDKGASYGLEDLPLATNPPKKTISLLIAKSSEHRLLLHAIRLYVAIAPGTFIKHNTVSNNFSWYGSAPFLTTHNSKRTNPTYSKGLFRAEVI